MRRAPLNELIMSEIGRGRAYAAMKVLLAEMDLSVTRRRREAGARGG